MIVTPADQPGIIEMILKAHPEKRRLIFVHIPKCAGTDMTANLGRRYPLIHQTLAVPNWTAPERLQAAVDAVEQELQNADTVLVGGHNRLHWVIKNNLYRPGKDRLFSVIRKPAEIVLSAVNYTLGKLIADPYGAEPDVRGWLHNMGVADVVGWTMHDLALRTLQSGAIPRNALCHFLGLNTVQSALDMIRESGIEITETSRYSRWAEATWGISFTTRYNASKALMALEDLPAETVSDLCTADAALYSELMEALADDLSVRLGLPQSLDELTGTSSEYEQHLVDSSLLEPDDDEITTDQPELVDTLGMPSRLAETIGALSRLSPKSRMASALPCKICENPAPFFDAVDFLKCTAGYPFGPSAILVPYHRCETCGFLFTSFFDTWTDLAFQRFIYNDDYIIIDPEYAGARPTRVAERFADLLAEARGSRLLDWGAGSGVFASAMAERGFVTESYDPFSAPGLPTGKFHIITCIETIEHVPVPMQAFREMAEHLTDDGMILVGETLQPEDIERIRCSWWYVAPRNGHCSTFDRRTMAAIANQLGLVFRHNSAGGPHVLHRHGLSVCSEIAERLGSAVMHFRLGAPGVISDGWNGVERPEGQPAFQWSASPELSWEVTVPAGPIRTLIVDLPFVHVLADFIGRCKLRIGESLVPISVRDHTIVGEVAGVAPGPLRVTLHTPPLRASKGTDARMIGIAMRVCHSLAAPRVVLPTVAIGDTMGTSPSVSG